MSTAVPPPLTPDSSDTAAPLRTNQSRASQGRFGQGRFGQGLSGFALVAIMMLYTGFAIPVAIVAMKQSFFFGLGLAAFLGWQWVRLPMLLTSGTGFDAEAEAEALRPQLPESVPQTTGNASFDAYRSELLTRLEREQSSFEGFVERLRAAKDKTEFDEFMDARAAEAKRQRSAKPD